jgi:cyclophilin family peptidyl-prolyl cis-trans isomerase
MILAFTKSPARRLATVGLVAVMFAGCSTPVVTPTPSPSALPTVAPPAPAYTLGPTMAPEGASGACPTSAPPAFTGKATVTMTTNFGNIVISVDGGLGANAAGSFIALARCGYYNNVIFHRLVPGFVIQAGDGKNARLPNLGKACDMGSGGPTWTIPDDKVTSTYKRGTISMARTSSANSGSSQFFIVLADSASSVLGSATANNYAIFGDVTKGMDVVDAIAAVPTGGDPCSGSTSVASMPLEPIVITSTIVS